MWTPSHSTDRIQSTTDLVLVVQLVDRVLAPRVPHSHGAVVRAGSVEVAALGPRHGHAVDGPAVLCALPDPLPHVGIPYGHRLVGRGGDDLGVLYCIGMGDN